MHRAADCRPRGEESIMMDRHLYITGMEGSGKSSLGKKVASNLHLRYVDTDKALISAFGVPIGEIYDHYGIETFQKAETNLLIWLTRQPPMIISTGGSCVMNPLNRSIMQASGMILMVERPLSDILSDIKLDRRPDLEKTGLEGVEKAYHERIGLYRSSADMILDNSRGYYVGVANMERMIRLQFGLYALN